MISLALMEGRHNWHCTIHTDYVRVAQCGTVKSTEFVEGEGALARRALMMGAEGIGSLSVHLSLLVPRLLRVGTLY